MRLANRRGKIARLRNLLGALPTLAILLPARRVGTVMKLYSVVKIAAAR